MRMLTETVFIGQFRYSCCSICEDNIVFEAEIFFYAHNMVIYMYEMRLMKYMFFRRKEDTSLI